MSETSAERVVVESRYELVERLDLGLGETWKARDTTLKDRYLALKFLRRLPAEATDVPEGLARHFMALRGLRKSCLLTTVGHGFWQGRPYLLHDLFEGCSLRATLAEARAANRYLARTDIEKIFDQVCLGVEAAHGASQPLFHGALTSASVLLRRPPGKDFEVRTLDFGLAPWLGAPSLDRKSQIKSGSDDAEPLARLRGDDLAALGLLLREMLADLGGPVDFEGTAPDRYRDDVPDAVRDIIARVVRNPEANFPTVGALRLALEHAWKEPVTPPPPPEAPRQAFTPPPPSEALRQEFMLVAEAPWPNFTPSAETFEAAPSPEETAVLTSLPDVAPAQGIWDTIMVATPRRSDGFQAVIEEDTRRVSLEELLAVARESGGMAAPPNPTSLPPAPPIVPQIHEGTGVHGTLRGVVLMAAPPPERPSMGVAVLPAPEAPRPAAPAEVTPDRSMTVRVVLIALAGVLVAVTAFLILRAR